MTDPTDDELRAAFAGMPPTDESGNVDLSLLATCLSLTIPQRFERHYGARMFAQKMKQVARERYGSVIDTLEAFE